MQTERDEFRRQLEQSEASRARYKAEVGNLQGYIKELEYVESLEIKAELSAPAEPSLLPDLCQLRDQVVKEWRVAKKGESKERIQQALDAFIEKLLVEAGNKSPNTETQE